MNSDGSRASTSQPARLPFLDGLRGLSALYVVLFHEVVMNDATPGELSRTMKGLRQLMNHGHVSVVIFIVLSGFSLTLPTARGHSKTMVGGLRGYARRRAARILPPYYAALILSLGSLLAYNILGVRFLAKAKTIEHGLSAGAILSHVFLVHNLSLDWVYSINSPMWSVATEWQIYFVFALVLLPAWRAIGIVPTVVASYVIGSLPYFMLSPTENFFWACPWFIGSFALGMAGALMGFSPAYAGSRWRRAPWGWLMLVTAAVGGWITVTELDATWPEPLIDLLTSLFAFCLVNYCVLETERSGETAFPITRVLGSRWAVALGGFYSLYLVQYPFLRLTSKILNALHLSRDANLLVQIVCLTPAIVCLAWVFAMLFEKPFLPGAAVRRRVSAQPGG